MKYFIVALTALTVVISSCKKLEDYEANQQTFEKTQFEIEEIITFTVPNSQFSAVPNLFNCMDLGIFGPIEYTAFIPTENPNPYAHLVKDIKPKHIIMELVNIPDCDFGMLQSAEVYVADNGITDAANFILQDPQDPSAPHNAVKVGEFMNIPDGIGWSLTIDANEDAVLDQFIHAGTFQTYMVLQFDRAFTKDMALIKSSMVLDVTLDNDY